VTSATPLDPTRRAFRLDRYPSLGPALADAFHAHRSNTFLVETDRGRVVTRLTFRDFLREVARLAAWMRARGLGPDDRVAIAMQNGPRWLEGAVAALGLGCVLVPLDGRAEGPELGRLLAHCRARALLTDGPVWRRLRDQPGAQVEVVLVHARLGPVEAREDWDRALVDEAALSTGWTPVARERDAPAAVVYSSGTTGGRPKGCVLTHGSYLHQLETLASLYPLAEDDVYLSLLPTNHALDFMCGFLVPALCGARVVHLRTLRPEWITGALKDQGVTHLSAVPAILTALERSLLERLDAQTGLAATGLRGVRALNAWLTRDRPREAVSRALLAPVHRALGGRLSRIFAGGAFVPRATARFLYDLGLPVAIGYGLTEACAVVTVNDLQPFRDDTVGLPLPGTDVRIDDRDEHGVGEVVVRGPQVFQGYLDDPGLTREALVDGWLRTGDLGVLDAAGHLRLVGRKKHMVVTAGGKNVYPEDVEGRFDGLAEVEEHAVVAAHAVWPARPGDDERLLLVVRARAELGPVVAEAARRARALPEHQRPAGLLVTEAPLPRTTSLKLKRDALASDLGARLRREDVRAL
jgi:long-chain acyl-CoA synthetase